jgi:hypothetical protein
MIRCDCSLVTEQPQTLTDVVVVATVISNAREPSGTQGRPEDENQGGVNNMKNADYNFFTQCM